MMETKSKHVLYECGICECLHRWDWNGDCREDAERFFDESEYAEEKNVSIYDIEIRSTTDRILADLAGE